MAEEVINYSALAKNIREVIDEKQGGALHMNLRTAEEFKRRRIMTNKLVQDNTFGSMYNCPVFIDEEREDGVVHIWN